ncbi:co-chaperone DjlA [Shewanella amazonensis]|uniref:Co-chaperone protein DjlA n=1 Tax=Shewanella amazonensis (strain ATCC BAA-1098 / SB2B) TaxID=326297 RepID=A1S9F9_SHEAM|nr:co-chaperone DjlA [Shewanella amazonensis]ABM01016.1 DnaJ domain protein [Shewanella amazonensis SB2B]
MKYKGKFFGFLIGFMFGKIFGALLGLVVGHWFDKRFAGASGSGSKRQQVFFSTTFAVMGHVAKASGRVTEADIRLASDLMDQLRLDSEARRQAQQAFRDGKAGDFDLKGNLRAFRLLSMGRNELLQMFLEIQIQVALADGELHPNEHRILKVVASELGFRDDALEMLLGRWQAEVNFGRRGGAGKTSLKDAYGLLGIEESATDQDVKRAYRKLMNEHHPDKLVAKGLPEEMMELAKRKAQDIQAAYEAVKAARKMR